MNRWEKTAALIFLAVTVWLTLPLQTNAAVDTDVLQDALPEDAQDELDGILPENADLKGGLAGLLQRGKNALGDYVRQAMGVGILMLGACMILSLAAGFSGDAGLSLPEKSVDFTAVAILLTASVSLVSAASGTSINSSTIAL